MRRVMNLVAVCLALVGLTMVVAPVFAEEKAVPQVTSVLGEVVSIDLVKSEVTVKQLKDVVTSIYENTTFSIAAETKIAKGNVILNLSDLKVGDKITLEYTADVSGKQNVKSITVEAQEVISVK